MVTVHQSRSDWFEQQQSQLRSSWPLCGINGDGFGTELTSNASSSSEERSCQSGSRTQTCCQPETEFDWRPHRQTIELIKKSARVIVGLHERDSAVSEWKCGGKRLISVSCMWTRKNSGGTPLSTSKSSLPRRRYFRPENPRTSKYF